MTSVQKKFDWPRARKLRLLDDLRLPSRCYVTEGARRIGVEGCKVLLLLRVLEGAIRDHDWCWPSERLLCERVCVSEKTLRRAIRYLESVGFLAVLRTKNRDSGRSQNRYKIAWSNVSEAAGEMPGDRDEANAVIEGGPSVAPLGRVEQPTNEAPSVGGKMSTNGGTNRPRMQTNRPREGDQSATEGGVIGHGWPVETLLSARNAPKRGGAIASDGEGTDPEPWKRIARKIATVVVIKTPDDRALIGSVAQALAAGRVAESDVWEAVESVEIRRPKNAAAWFRACLKNRLAESGRSLDQLGVPRQCWRRFDDP